VLLKIPFFCDVVPLADRRFRGSFWLLTSKNIYQSTWHNIPENFNLKYLPLRLFNDSASATTFIS
jgi:hypothetical protein